MKKQYLIAFLLLVGFAVTTTMAFSVTDETVAIKLIDVTDVDYTVMTTSAYDLLALGKNTVVYSFDVAHSGDVPFEAYITFVTGTDSAAYTPTTIVSAEWKVTAGGTYEPITGLATGDSLSIYFKHETTTVWTTGDDLYIKISGTHTASSLIEEISGVFVAMKGSTGTASDSCIDAADA